MIMTSQQLQYVLALADERSFSKASQKLYVTQPSLSQFIKNIETQLNVTLFDRSSAPIRLTQAGEIYVASARKMLALMTELDNQLSDLSNLGTGTLTLGTTPFRAASLLPKSVAAFRKKYPGIQLHIVEETRQTLEEMLAEGTIDICITADKINAKLFQTETLAEERLYLAVPPDDPFNVSMQEFQLTAEDIVTSNRRQFQAESIQLPACASQAFILLHHERHGDTLAYELSQLIGFDRSADLYTERIETAFSWTLAGIACSFIPDTFIRFGNCDRHPVYYKIGHPSARSDIVIAYKKNRYLPRASSAYILLLKQLIGHGTWMPPRA